MKKKIISLLFSALFLLVLQQSVLAQKAGYPLAATALRSTAFGNTLDTLTNTAAHYFVTPKITSMYEPLCIAFRGIELSGTTDGIISLEASGDSVTWYPYYTGTGLKDTTGGPLQLDLADVTTAQGIRWVIRDAPDLWYRVKAVGVGTPSVAISAKYWGRKP